MKLADALEAIVMDGRFTVEKGDTGDYIVVYNSESGDEAARFEIQTLEYDFAGSPFVVGRIRVVPDDCLTFLTA